MTFSMTLDVREIAGLFHREKPGEKAEPGMTSIEDYLDRMVLEYEAGGEQCLFLPSLVSLSECFRCSAVEVHQALNDLRDQGFDFFIMGFECPITFWYPNRICLEEAG